MIWWQYLCIFGVGVLGVSVLVLVGSTIAYGIKWLVENVKWDKFQCSLVELIANIFVIAIMLLLFVTAIRFIYIIGLAICTSKGLCAL